MAEWRYDSKGLVLFFFIFTVNVGFGVFFPNDLLREVFLKKEILEHICTTESDRRNEILSHKLDSPYLEERKVLKNDEEETPKTGKNVLDTLKIFLKKVKDEVVEDSNKRNDFKRKDSLNELHIDHVESVYVPAKEEDKGRKTAGMEDESEEAACRQARKTLPVKSKAKATVDYSQPTTLNEYGKSLLGELDQLVLKEEMIVSEGRRHEENEPLDTKFPSMEKATNNQEWEGTRQDSVSRLPESGQTGSEEVSHSLGTTPQSDNFVERSAPWAAPKSPRNLSDSTPTEKEDAEPPEEGTDTLLQQPEQSAKLEREAAPPGNETEETSRVAQSPEGNVTSAAEVDSTMSESMPPQEVPDDIQKDQLETYSQFAERVTAEKKNGASSSNGHAGNGQLVKGPKVKTKNYASTDCGAKFLAANPESLHSHKVINSNKDEYMLNKCTGKIWTIVELCESIRPQKFDIANFELFSNSPKDIYLFGSRRYPIREWSSLGAYEGEEGNRDVQSFNVETPEFFKFIKLEVHSYYGTEFFCPLSQFKIYGLSEFEVIEETEDPEEDQIIEEEVLDELKVEEDTKDKPGMIPDVIKSVLSSMIEAIKRGSRSGNRTDEPEINTFTQSCRSLHANFSIAEDVCPFAESLNYILACYYDEYLKLMARPFIASVVKNSNFCRRLATVVCDSPETDDRLVYDSVCNNSYACVMLSPKHILAMCHMQDPFTLRNVVGCSPSQSEVQPTPINISSQTSTFDRLEANTPFLDHDPTTTPDQPARTIVENEGTPGVPRPSDSALLRALPGEETKENMIHLPHIDLKPLSIDLTQKGKDTQAPTPESASNATIAPVALDKSAVQNAEKKERKGEKESAEKASVGDDAHSLGQGVLPSTATPPTTSTESRVVSHSNKESVVVRLSNKIKVLEHNMSISSQYLEELSRRYKRQMEDMQRQFNVTILALNSTSQTAYERDLYHQKRLEALENQLEELAKMVSALAEEKESLLTRVVEQHMILLFVEVVVMFLVFSICLRRRREDTLRAPASADATGKVDSDARWGEGTFHQADADPHGRETPSLCRRRSVDSIRAESETKPKERRLSGHLAMTGSYKNLLITDTTTTKEKKKKKKKVHLERSLSNASISEKSRLCAPTKKEKKLEKLKRSSAGVLFSGEKGKDEGWRSKGYNGNVMEEVSPDDWQMVRKSKGKSKVEATTSYVEEPYVLSSDLKRGKIILDHDPMVKIYPQQYYMDMPFDHGSVYGKERFDINYKDITLYDYNSEIKTNPVDESLDDVYLPELNCGGPVVSDYYSAGEGSSYQPRSGESVKNGSHFEDSVDASFWETKSPKFLAKARSCTEFRSPGVTSSFKGRTKLRSDNWEWYSSQPSRLLSSCNSAAEVVSNSSSDSSVKSKVLISENRKEALRLEKKKKKNKGTKLTNGESRQSDFGC